MKFQDHLFNQETLHGQQRKYDHWNQKQKRRHYGKGATLLTHNGFTFLQKQPHHNGAPFSGIHINALEHEFSNLYFPAIEDYLHIYFVFRPYCQ